MLDLLYELEIYLACAKSLPVKKTGYVDRRFVIIVIIQMNCVLNVFYTNVYVIF